MAKPRINTMKTGSEIKSKANINWSVMAALRGKTSPSLFRVCELYTPEDRLNTWPRHKAGPVWRCCRWMNGGGVCGDGGVISWPKPTDLQRGLFTRGASSVRQQQWDEQMTTATIRVKRLRRWAMASGGSRERGDRKALYVQEGTSEECGDLAPTESSS